MKKIKALIAGALILALSSSSVFAGVSVAIPAGVDPCGLCGGIFNTAVAVGYAAEANKNAKEDISPEKEYYIGRDVAAEILNQYRIINNKQLDEYLNKICCTIAFCSDKPYAYNGYHVAVLDTDEVNAFATMGGHIFITAGLLKILNSEDEVAAVIAHEMAHIQLQHGKKTIEKDRKNKAAAANAALVFSAATIVDAVTDNPVVENITNLTEIGSAVVVMSAAISEVVLVTGYSRDKEYEADEYAVELMLNCGYDPTGMLDALYNMKTINTSGGLFSTHPKIKDRIKKVEKQVNKINFTGTSKEARIPRFNNVMKYVNF